jgi:hypothetical protein
MPDTLERHDKFDVDDRFTLPKLEDIIVNGAVQHDTIDSTNDYYDTSDHDLRAQGVLLQRRDGDGETGWQLAVPDDGGRTELHWIHSDSPPDEVTTLLTGLTLGKEVASVAKIHTVRERYRISAPQPGEPCIEVDDDHVRASIGEHLLAWREVKVDSGAGARTLTKRLTKRLRAAGARPSRYPSKLAHAVPAEPAASSSTPANRALTDYLNAQLDQIAAGDIGLRRGKDPIHDTRVAIRRLRSTLRVFRKVLDQPAIGDLDGELKWFAADRRLAAALGTGDDVMLHRARKAAKRARYAAELCKPVDKKAKRTVKYYKNIQSLLGDHQDTVVATEALRRMAVAAGTTPDENGFTFGMLYAREQQIARQCRKDARRLG